MLPAIVPTPKLAVITAQTAGAAELAVGEQRRRAR